MVNVHNLSPNIPVEGCFVCVDGGNSLGIVQEHKNINGMVSVKVSWGANRQTKWHNLMELRNGFRRGHIVQDIPRSNTRKPLGTGTVLATRQIAGRELVSVQLHNTGESRWLPFERLVRIRDARIKYQRAEAPEADSGERFRLKALAYALDSWNQVTGALDRFDVDPLPHQIDLVHRIMTSEQSNWLIADDVGLGKTIEVGLLLAAMKRRRQARRVLIVSPAGVVRQWQDEMDDKFSETFRIYGLDFNVNQPDHWSGYNKVIVSLDRIKSDLHSSVFAEAGDWDIIVFDEAHHLTKTEHQAATQRYQIAEQLRHQTDAFVFLSGTPHRGKTDQFINILRLLRPDLVSRFVNIFTDPSVVAEVVLRNKKSLATDANGKFIFRGQDTHLVKVSLSDSAKEFSNRLQHYLRNGYAASEAGGSAGRAIGFVMTTYRKLASSSIAAIELALQRRLARLQGIEDAHSAIDVNLAELDDAFQEGTDGRDDLERVADTVSKSVTDVNPFFSGEQAEIDGLLAAAKDVKKSDQKLQRFLDEIVSPLEKEREKMLIFTEYRATQQYIVNALEQFYPDRGVSQINGSMSLDEKRRNIHEFNQRSMFMVSTEAGGEGINLHEQCNILVNYDLPWNPGRLVQRAGRLYRYGQTKRVIVFNLLADDGFDSKALGMMLSRVYTVERDLSYVSPEFREGLETEIIGEVLERMDIASLLTENKEMNISHTEDDINIALDRAEEAKKQQEHLFSHIEGYDPQATAAMHKFGPDDVLVFLEGILPYRGVQIRNRLYGGRVLELELPDEMRGRFSEFPERATVVRITTDRKLARSRENLIQMDFKSPFFSSLIEFAKTPEFKGEYTNIARQESGVLGLYKLRWQTDQGVPREEALLSVFLPHGSQSVVANPAFFGRLLIQTTELGKHTSSLDPDVRRNALALIDNQAHAHLSSRCTALRHPNDVVLLATADLISNKDG